MTQLHAHIAMLLAAAVEAEREACRLLALNTEVESTGYNLGIAIADAIAARGKATP